MTGATITETVAVESAAKLETISIAVIVNESYTDKILQLSNGERATPCTWRCVDCNKVGIAPRLICLQLLLAVHRCRVYHAQEETLKSE